MKKQLLMGALASAVMAGVTAPAMAEDVGNGFDVSANVGIVSDYLWRGVSQSNNREAIQGGIDAKHASGAYAGLWMSSLSAWFAGDDYAALEQDLYAGYGFSVTDDIAVDLRYTQYLYPDSSNLNFDEIHAAVSAFGATAGVDYADNNANGNSTTMHYYGNYSHSLPMDMTVSATYGLYDLKDNLVGGDEDDYTYYSVGISKKVLGLNLGLSYNNTDLTSSECNTVAGGITESTSSANDACGEQFVLSVTKSL